MHPTLISAVADQIVRERSRNAGIGPSRRGDRGPRLSRRAGFRLVRRPLVARRAS